MTTDPTIEHRATLRVYAPLERNEEGKRRRTRKFKYKTVGAPLIGGIPAGMMTMAEDGAVYRLTGVAKRRTAQGTLLIETLYERVTNPPRSHP